MKYLLCLIVPVLFVGSASAQKPPTAKPILVVKANDSSSVDYIWSRDYVPGCNPSITVTGTLDVDPLWGVVKTPCEGYVVKVSIQWTQNGQTQSSFEYSTGLTMGQNGGGWKASVPCTAPPGTQVVITVGVTLVDLCNGAQERVAGGFFYTIPQP